MIPCPSRQAQTLAQMPVSALWCMLIWENQIIQEQKPQGRTQSAMHHQHVFKTDSHIGITAFSYLASGNSLNLPSGDVQAASSSYECL